MVRSFLHRCFGARTRFSVSTRCEKLDNPPSPARQPRQLRRCTGASGGGGKLRSIVARTSDSGKFLTASRPRQGGVDLAAMFVGVVEHEVEAEQVERVVTARTF